MQVPRNVVLWVILVAACGCNAKSEMKTPADARPAAADGSGSAEAPLATFPAAVSPTAPATPPNGVANSTGDKVAPAPPEPSAEQIAKWNVPESEPLRLLACYDGFGDPAVLCMALSPDGKQFVTGGAKLTLWNTKNAKPTAEILARYKGNEVERPLSAVAISADGKWLAAGDQKGTRSHLDPERSARSRHVPSTSGRLTSVGVLSRFQAGWPRPAMRAK